MEMVFLKVLNMSISASWVVMVVVLARLFLRRGPKWIRCVLWLFVALRLVCPFSIESIFSLIPSAETVPQKILYDTYPQVQTGIPALNSAVNPVIGQSFAADPGASINPLQVAAFICSVIWCAGMAGMALYALVSYLCLRYRTREAIPTEPGVRVCDRIPEPFILGVFKPVIFLPSGMPERDAQCVIAHERAHLARKDHWWKPIGFLLLTVYWFNPVLWLAYYLLSRDIELACDEKVVARMDPEGRKAYSYALINCSAREKWITACPLAFGEVGVKARIKSALSYKKPAIWVIAVCVIICVAVAVCFLTDPENGDAADPGLCAKKGGTGVHGVELTVTTVQQRDDTVYLTARWDNTSGEEILFGETFALRHTQDAGTDLAADLSFHTIAYGLSSGSSREIVYAFPAGLVEKQGLYRLEASFDWKQAPYIAWVELVRGELTQRSALDGYLDRIVGNREVAVSSNPFDYIRAEQAAFDAIVAGGEDMLPEMLMRLRHAENHGLREYIMAVACAQITGVGIKGESYGGGWGSAGQWLALYDAELQRIREQYPMYFGLSDTDGLCVYAWEMAKDYYWCALVSGTEEKTMTELVTLPGAELNTMRRIISSYETPASLVDVRLVRHPISSYHAVYSEGDTVRIRRALGLE